MGALLNLLRKEELEVLFMIDLAELFEFFQGQWSLRMQMKLKFSLLIGCRELSGLGGINAIIEGDSFSAIQ